MLNKSKKILFIALHYPPSEGIADIRATNMVRELVNLGHDVTVLTAKENYYKRKSSHLPKDINKIKIIRVPFNIRLGTGNLKENKKIPNIIRRILLKFLPIIGMDYLSFWKKNAIKRIKELNKNFDYVIATGPPYSTFSLAKKLADIFNAKYILDYRDLWNFSPHQKSNNKNFITIRKEKKLLENAFLVIFVSESMQKIVKENFNVNNSIIITNGFNRKSLDSIPIQNFNKFTISYTGRFYPPKRVIDPLFKVFKNLKKNNKEIYDNLNFIYCGPDKNCIEKKALKYDIYDLLINKGLVPREESFSITKSSNLSVVITSVFSNASLSDKSILTGKLFETIGLNTKILAIAPFKTDIRTIFSKYNIGSVFSGEEIEKIAQFIINEFNSNNEIKVQENCIFEWAELIKKLDKNLI